MKTWKRNFRADIRATDYAVLGFRLVEDRWYGEDGMWDTPDTLPLEEYRIEILSWREDRYGSKIADDLSDTKLKAEFRSRDEANRVWETIKNTYPTYETLQQMGFKEFV